MPIISIIPGLIFSGILRAFIRNAESGRIVQGGSTITQQVTRTFLLSREKTYTRKIREGNPGLAAGTESDQRGDSLFIPESDISGARRLWRRGRGQDIFW